MPLDYLFQNLGWTCPKCGSCYAPTIPQCDNCSVQNIRITPTALEIIKETVRAQRAKEATNGK